jgi:hypothetical protein
MTPTDLCVALRRLTPDDIHRVASSIVGESAGDEVDAWRATMAIDRALRHAHRRRQAAYAAWDAAQAVQQAAVTGGIRLPDPEVTSVARAAAEIARGLVAGDEVTDEVVRLLQHWLPLLATA